MMNLLDFDSNGFNHFFTKSREEMEKREGWEKK